MSTNPVTYICNLCTFNSTSSQKYKGHLNKIHNLQVSVCKNCPEVFEELSKLFLHAREVHNKAKRDEKQNCKLFCSYEGCSYKTNNGGLMKHHYRSHTNHKPHVCEICHKTFTQKSNMKTHYNRHLTTGVTFPCDICDKIFYSYDIYLSHLGTREHELSHLKSLQDNKFRCMCCKQEFDTIDDVMDHTIECTASLQLGETISCTKCHAKMLANRDVMKNHIKIHRKELCCTECDEVFDDISKWNFHLTKVHQKHVNRNVACRYCEQIFPNLEERNEHINLVHSDTKNRHLSRGDNGRMACHICNNFFANSQIIMQKHIAKEHFGDMDVDEEFYKGNQLPKREPLDQNKPRNRGRPRLCDQVSEENGMIMTSYVIEEPKKKRGRPQKVVEITSDESNKEMKRRGRPRKMKIEMEETFMNREMEENFLNTEFGENFITTGNFGGINGTEEFENYNIDDIDNGYFLDDENFPIDQVYDHIKTEDYNFKF